MVKYTKPIVILSLFPNARGLGHVCLEPPKTVLNSGMVVPYPVSNETIMKRFAKFIDVFNPTVVIVKDYGDETTRQSKRVSQLIGAITQYAREKKLPVYRYSRQQIRDVFEQFGAKSKYEIVREIVKTFPQLESRAPKIRKPWEAEHYHMAEFDALALAITHRYLTEY